MISAISGIRRPKRSPSKPNISAPTGRIIKVTVMAKVIFEMLRPKSCPTGTRTKVRRKKSSASRVHPRKHATKVFRCSRVSDLKMRIASILEKDGPARKVAEALVPSAYLTKEAFSTNAYNAAGVYQGCAL